MSTVGVRELKASLSKHLVRVRAGTVLTVTDRGRPIARLTPIDPPKDAAWAMRIVADGGAAWSGGKPAGLSGRRKAKGRLASEMVIEDRR